jgi:hypothetical protein
MVFTNKIVWVFSNLFIPYYLESSRNTALFSFTINNTNAVICITPGRESGMGILLSLFFVKR